MTIQTISRRRFLAGGAAACTASTVAPLLRPSMAFAADGASAHTLVLVVLGGGMDGLSALVPAGDPHYGQQRKSTAIPDSRAIGVDPIFALHPSLAPLGDLWRDGRMAAVPALGTVTRSRSHFAEMAVVAGGTGGRGSDGTGWLARHLLTRPGSPPVTLQGVSCGPAPALELAGHGGAFCVPDLNAVGIGGWDPARLPTVETAISRTYAAADPSLSIPAASAFDAVARLRSVAAAPTSSQASYDDDPWSTQLREVGRLMRAGVGMEAAVVNFDGWDTHAAQGGSSGQLATLLGRLARALATFVTDVHDRLDRVTIVVLSEFGRRVAENGSGGTDHGRGGVGFVLGGGVRGGVHGTWPGLDPAALDEGDVAVTTDVRSLLAEIVRGPLQNPAISQVFPDFTPTSLGIA